MSTPNLDTLDIISPDHYQQNGYEEWALLHQFIPHRLWLRELDHRPILPEDQHGQHAQDKGVTGVPDRLFLPRPHVDHSQALAALAVMQ